MPETYFRSGQAAKFLQISSRDMRRLCELGMIEAEFSDGRQWRIPTSEVEKLQRLGVPPIPSGDLAPHESNGRSTRSGQGLLAPPSASATGSAEEALMSEHELTIARNRVERLRAEFEGAQISDEFAERERQKAE